MKAVSILAALALGQHAHGFHVPAPANNLEARQRAGGGGFGGGNLGGGSVTLCTWTGHCIGDTCSADEECDLDYACVNRKCASSGTGAMNPPAVTTVRTTARPGQGGARTTTIYVTAPRPTTTARPGQGQSTCEWTGHCLGDTCKTENDCDGQLICTSGRCANVGGGSPVVSTRPGGVQPSIRTTVQTLRTTARTTAKPQPTQGGTPACGDNPFACIGVSCRQNSDCGFDLILCKSGVCGL